MKSIRHAMRIARRYADGGSDDEDQPPLHPPLARPGDVAGQRRILQIDPLQGTGVGMPVTHEPVHEPAPAPAPAPMPAEGSEVKPNPQTSVQHWSQAIADHLVSKHGDDYPAAEEAIRDIGTNYSQRAANAVWEKMPLEHQMGMMDARMQDDLGPAAYRMATDPANWKVEADRKLATNYQERQAAHNESVARGETPSLFAPQQQGPQLPGGYTVQPYPPHGYNVMHPNGGIYAQGSTPQQAAENAIRMGVARNEPDFHGFAYPPDAPFRTEERIPVRTAPTQGAAGVSRSGYVSPYGIHSQQQEPPEPTSEEDYGATEWGHEYHGEVPRESHPFFDATKKAMDDFQTTMQPKVGNINEFAKEFFAGYDTRSINFANEHGDMSWDGTLMDKGNPVGDFSISINSATNSAHLGLMELDPAYRGIAGPKLLRNQIDMYQKMGLDYVDLYAAGGGNPYGGSYAWAKYGFIPNQEDWNLMRARFGQRLNTDTFKPRDPEVTQIVKNILSSPDPHAIWTLSDVTAPNVNGKPIGKTLLLSMGWSGHLTFKDPKAMERFDAYLKRRPKRPSLDRSPND